MNFSSKVIHGHSLGSTLGFPTINLSCNGVDLNFGVYICKVKVLNKLYFGVMQYGHRETFSDINSSCEIFLIDFSGDLYGKNVEVDVKEKIRDIKKFKNKNELINQIACDVEYAKKSIMRQ